MHTTHTSHSVLSLSQEPDVCYYRVVRLLKTRDTASRAVFTSKIVPPRVGANQSVFIYLSVFGQYLYIYLVLAIWISCQFSSLFGLLGIIRGGSRSRYP